MANLKIKTIASTTKGIFDAKLEKLINSVEDASIQYRTTSATDGTVLHSALVIYIDKVEEVATTVPTGVGRTMDERLGVADGNALEDNGYGKYEGVND